MMKILTASIIVFILLRTTIHAYKSYSNHQLWRLHIKNNEQVAKLLEFSRLAYIHDIDFWSEEFRINVPVS